MVGIMSLTLSQIKRALARGYWTDENKHKRVDVLLLEAMATEVMIEINATPPAITDKQKI
jgi:hypothetical protein